MDTEEGSTSGLAFWKTVKSFISGKVSVENIINEVTNDRAVNIKGIDLKLRIN